MCSRRPLSGIFLGAVILALVLLPASTGAQETGVQETGEHEMESEGIEAFERSLLARLEALEGPLERARERHRRESAFFDSLDRARRARETDSVAVGPFEVVSQPDRLTEARSAIERAWEELRLLLGDAPVLTGATIVYDPSSDLGGFHFGQPSYRVTGRNWSTFRFDEELLQQSIRSVLGRDVARHYPRYLRIWVGGNGPVPAPREAHTDMYRQMALAPSGTASACVGGSVEACLSALGLEPHDAPLTTWYEADHLLGVAAQPRGRGNRRVKIAAEEWTRCFGSREGGSCVDVQNDPDVWLHLIPFGAPLRSELVALAVERGGEGAVARLVEPVMRWTGSGDVEAIRRAGGGGEPTYADFAVALRAGLESASGMDAEELVGLWRERLVAARPETQADGETHRTATFFWILFFAVLSTRSTRWRLG